VIAERCALEGCRRARIPDGLFCGRSGGGHMADWLAGRIRKTETGTYLLVTGPQPRSPWVERAGRGELPANVR
jgi:hypothetical protein